MRKSLILICVWLPLFLINLFSRETKLLQTGWKFAKGNHENAILEDFDDSHWKNVTIPHDWGIEGPVIIGGDGSTGKLPWKNEGWYRLKINIPEYYKGKTVYLLFDGVMAFPKVYVNGKLAGSWDYGYNSFFLNISDFIKPGRQNLIAVHVDTREHESRWYPGAGIYRKVQLIALNPVHIDIWGIHVYTPIIKPHSTEVSITTTLNNMNNEKANIKIVHHIFNPQGIKITTDTSNIYISPKSKKEFETRITLLNPQRWDIDSPALYSIHTEIYNNGSLEDSISTIFGIRTIRFTAKDGFYLNDRRVQLKGVNLHHDHGPLGAAFYTRAMERQLEIMKSMGCNAIRTSHNMPAPEVLDLCDRMGILVFAEAFDKYDKKADILPETNFDDFAYRNIRNFVVRDRNHPCIIIWSVGNEMWDVQRNENNGFLRLHTMLSYVRKFDPTRPVTMVCDDQNSAYLRHFDLYDVHAWNYGRRYSVARMLEPNKAVILSESAATVSTRGYYEFPLPQNKTDFSKNLQVSSYDLNAPVWADLPDDAIMWQQEENYIAGEFIWSGFDYLGEPTPYDKYGLKELGIDEMAASRSSYFGVVDLCGIPKDRYYLYKSYWNSAENNVHIVPHWNWVGMEGKEIPVFVYTNGDCAELFLNGESLGIKCKNPNSKNSIERTRIMWNNVKYRPGQLKAVAYRENMKIGEKTIQTVGTPVALRLSADRKVIKRGGLDLSYIIVEAIDPNGNVYPLADNEVTFNIKGKGEIAGVANGNPQSMEPFQASSIKLFGGKALIVVRSGFENGKIELTASSKNLKSASIVITVE